MCSDGREAFGHQTLHVYVDSSKPLCAPSFCRGLLQPPPSPTTQRKKALSIQVILLATTRWHCYPKQDKAGKLVTHGDKQIQRLRVLVQGTMHLISQSFQTTLPLCVFLLPQKLVLLFCGPSLQEQICPKLHPDGSREGEDMRAEQSISPSAIATISSTS